MITLTTNKSRVPRYSVQLSVLILGCCTVIISFVRDQIGADNKTPDLVLFTSYFPVRDLVPALDLGLLLGCEDLRLLPAEFEDDVIGDRLPTIGGPSGGQTGHGGTPLEYTRQSGPHRHSSRGDLGCLIFGQVCLHHLLIER